MMDEVISKYLAREADEVSRLLPRKDENFAAEDRFATAVVVPLYGEDPRCLDRLLQAGALRRRPGFPKNLLVLVVNEPRGAPAVRRERNRAFLADLELRFPVDQRRSAAPVSLLTLPETHDPAVLLVDLTSAPLDPKEGVGRARKIGFDCALRLFHDRELQKPFSGSADADVALPADYLKAFDEAEGAGFVRGLPKMGALLFPYRHEASGDPVMDASMEQVEMTFRLYVLGLARAGSPYAYHSLGSALAVSLPHYARVRGFPRRSAGEDFHLLSKLAQIAPLRRLTAPPISIRTRVSDRVPFGTGPSLHNALARGEGVLTYHPDAYRLLGTVLARLEMLVRCPQRNVDGPFSQDQNLPLWVHEWVARLWTGIEANLAACPTEGHRVRRLHESFDALKTLQFIHEAHRYGLEMVPIERAAALMGMGAENGLFASLRAEEEALPEWVGPVPLERNKPA